MPTFNIAQLTAFLNALREPAQLYDVRGNLVAENLAAQAVAWPDQCDPDECGNVKNIVHTVDLGEGWFMRRMSLAGLPYAPVRLSGQNGTRPNLQALMSGITHELRNPLAAILTAAGLLQDDSDLQEENAMLLNVVRKEARRMNQILTEFSLYVKLPQPHPEEFNLTPTVSRTVKELRDKGTLGESITVETHLPKPLLVCADPNQIEQVLFRLLENASLALAGQADGTIKLRSYVQNDTAHVVLCIEDNGPGFSEEELQNAFSPFYSTRPQAVGLGLSIVHVAVQAAGGAIWIENLADANALDAAKEKTTFSSGARVCFSLPSQAVEI